MQTIDFKNAYYIKLGRGGKWEEPSIRENKVRIGWDGWTIEDINQRNWEALKNQHRREYKNRGAAAADVNALRTVVESTSDDIWITFYKDKLWWCRVEGSSIFVDETSKYRMVTGQWRSDNIQGETLSISRIPGSISKIQRFQGTVCRVREVEILRRLLNNQPSQVYQAISEAQKRLIEQVEKGLSGLHWKDFEILVDLIFRNVGWRRVSTLGEQMKDWDMALRDPITGDQYLVQVKSAATVDDFEKCAEKFSSESFRKFYFVVHSPEEKLASYQGIMGESVELILPKRLAHMVVDFGLTNWLLNKIR